MSPEFRLPPPAESPVPYRQRALEYMALDIVGATDDEGVPLNSDRDKILQMPREFWQYGPNPYPESRSRSDTEVPVSNLERDRLRQHLPVMYELVAKLRAHYCEAVRQPKDTELDVYHASELASLLGDLPLYLLYRAESPLKRKGQVPAVLSVLSHAAEGSRAGFASAVEIMHGENGPVTEVKVERILGKKVCGHAALSAAETRGVLVGDKIRSNTICAAGPRTIERFIDTIVSGDIPKHKDQADLRTQAGDILKRLNVDNEFVELLGFSVHLNVCQMTLLSLRARPAGNTWTPRDEESVDKFFDAQIEFNRYLGRRGTLPDRTHNEFERIYDSQTGLVR